jgi:UDP-MurNAc hydroxylase
VHWDHWHGLTLKKFLNKDVLIVTHQEPNKRSYDDLKDFGFTNIKILKHGQSFTHGDLKLTAYQFGLFLNDSALVVETPEYKILNANDCKIAGASLEQIKNKHGQFDFALRSHSTANDRVCYKIEGSDEVFDDAMHYSRSFKLFMENVKPKYAVPFASNHCHLHKDVIHFNKFVNDPYKLQQDMEELGGLQGTELKIMLSGDSWSPADGFDLLPENKKFFEAKDTYIAEYAEQNQEKLENYYRLESRQRLTKRTLQVFEKQLQAIPKFLKKKLKDWNFAVELRHGEKESFLQVNPYNGTVEKIDKENALKINSRIVMPLIVFNDAVNKNMFHHSGISKRNLYLFKNQEEFHKWSILNGMLDRVELQVFPIRASYIFNFMGSYVRRWREVLVYMKAFLLLRKGFKMYDVEEKILSEH